MSQVIDHIIYQELPMLLRALVFLVIFVVAVYAYDSYATKKYIERCKKKK